MSNGSTTTPPNGLLEPVRARRDALQSAAQALESALAETAATPQWRDEVRTALERTQEVLEQHVSETAGAEGLPASVIQAAPRLAGPAQRLAAEHSDLAERQRTVAAMAGDPAIPPEAVRDAAAELAELLLRHVRQAHDLLVDAAEDELGGGD